LAVNAGSDPFREKISAGWKSAAVDGKKTAVENGTIFLELPSAEAVLISGDL